MDNNEPTGVTEFHRSVSDNIASIKGSEDRSLKSGIRDPTTFASSAWARAWIAGWSVMANIHVRTTETVC